jgi:hypothetical protein
VHDCNWNLYGVGKFVMQKLKKNNNQTVVGVTCGWHLACRSFGACPTPSVDNNWPYLEGIGLSRLMSGTEFELCTAIERIDSP